MNSTCGYSPVFHSSAPIFDAPGVGCAMVATPEAMINRLLFISDRKVLRVLNMRRWPTDHAAGSGVFRYRLRSGCWPRMIYSVFKVREGSCVVLPPPISKKLLLFEPPKQKKFEKLFSLLTTFGKKPPVLNERKLKIQRKKPRKSSDATKVPSGV